MTVMFGGSACPLGLRVQFVKASVADVIAALPGNMGNATATETDLGFADALTTLLPFEAPWTRMLFARAGHWTAIANNFINGGDGTAPGHAVARRLGVRCVIASHSPRYGPGHAQTQLEVLGPEGQPPLGYIRTVSATATDGRWGWYTSGVPFDFEEVERYEERIKRKRFDRPMLLRYLTALGIPVEDADYGEATLLQEHVTWPTRKVSLEEARANYAI